MTISWHRTCTKPENIEVYKNNNKWIMHISSDDTHKPFPFFSILLEIQFCPHCGKKLTE